VLVHPPGGIVGGDELHVQARLDPGTHALVTTPGATRFYRSDGPTALQSAELALGEGARLEWLPLETLAYSGCRAINRVHARLHPGAQLLAWDLLGLGLPAAGQPFEQGEFRQELALAGVWQERGRLRADDRLLLESPLGLGGHRVLGCLWFAAGDAIPEAMRDRLLDAARAHVAESPLSATAGATAPQPQVVVLRVLAHRVEPAMALFQAVRAAWREVAWSLGDNPPRVWRT
jgi:urease accessory protein